MGTKADGTSVLFACNDQDGLTEGETVVDTNGEKLSVESATASVDGGSKIWVQDRAEGYKVHEIDLATGKSGYDSGPNRVSMPTTKMTASFTILLPMSGRTWL